MFWPILCTVAIAVPTTLGSCPTPANIQSSFIKEEFDIKAFAQGQRYYELAYKGILKAH